MKNETLITVVLDRSGSMSSIKKDMEGGFNSFVKEQLKVINDEVKVNLYKFDDYYETEYENLPLAKVPRLNLEPRGMTALYDALGKSINNVGERLAKLPEMERPVRVVFVIITDGGENASKEFCDPSKLADMIKHQQDQYSWNFVFMGANQDSFLVARTLNINTASVMNFAFNASGVGCAYDSLSNNMTSYRSSTTENINFTDADYAAQKLAGASNI